MARVFVSIGTNQERERNVRAAVRELREAFDDLRLSPVYETEAVGFVGDPFFNLVASFESELPLDAIVDRLRAIETRCGRVRTDKRFGPRTLDIDVLVCGEQISDDESLEVPRSELLREAYVLKPLADLAPETRHPVLGESFAALYRRLALDEAGIEKSDFDPCDTGSGH